jgi:hypothetical protein
MTTLYDLVFDIRQEVDDISFRIQDTGAKVDLFLRTLSSLKSSLISSSDEDAPREVPAEEKDEEIDIMPDVAPRAAPGAATAVNRESDGEAMDEVE